MHQGKGISLQPAMFWYLVHSEDLLWKTAVGQDPPGNGTVRYQTVCVVCEVGLTGGV